MQRNITKRLIIWAVIVAAILMIPFLTRAPWTASDFIFAGVALYGCATAYELTTKNMNNRKHRIMVGIAILTVLIFIWGIAVTGE